MKVREEVNRYSNEEDKEILLWLLENYSQESKFKFVADCYFRRYGTRSYECDRIWYPTKEGRLIYNHRADLQ